MKLKKTLSMFTAAALSVSLLTAFAATASAECTHNDYDMVSEIAPTCAEEGNMAYAVCRNCDAILRRPNKKPTKVSELMVGDLFPSNSQLEVDVSNQLYYIGETQLMTARLVGSSISTVTNYSNETARLVSMANNTYYFETIEGSVDEYVNSTWIELTDFEQTVLPATGMHTHTKHSFNADCVNGGTRTYYTCNECGAKTVKDYGNAKVYESYVYFDQLNVGDIILAGCAILPGSQYDSYTVEYYPSSSSYIFIDPQKERRNLPTILDSYMDDARVTEIWNGNCMSVDFPSVGYKTVEDDDLTVDKSEGKHSLAKINSASFCEQAGWKEYYQCQNCGLYGYLKGTYARDKDAVVASMLTAEMAAYYAEKGLTLYEVINNLYDKYGGYYEELESITFEGIEGANKIKEIMKLFRENTPDKIGECRICKLTDYLKDTDLPKSDVLYFELDNDVHFAVRPSGTEPKVKIYYLSKGVTFEDAKIKANATKEAVNAIMK